MKTVLFVPGSGETLHSRDYAAVLRAFESKGYRAKFVPIQWRRTTIDDWVAELLAEYEKHAPQDVILAGFSWGAMTALAAAAQRSSAELWLFSLSPYFPGDKEIVKGQHGKIARYVGKHRQAAFARLDFQGMTQSIQARTLIFAGEREPLELKRRCTSAAKCIRGAQLIIVPETRHAIDDSNYITAITENI